MRSVIRSRSSISEAGELLGVVHDPHVGDEVVAHRQPHGARHPAFRILEHRAELAVDRHELEHETRAGAFLRDADREGRDAIRAAHRFERGMHATAAVRAQDDVVGEELRRTGDVACGARREEAGQELAFLLFGRDEARAAFLDVGACARRELAASRPS